MTGTLAALEPSRQALPITLLQVCRIIHVKAFNNGLEHCVVHHHSCTNMQSAPVHFYGCTNMQSAPVQSSADLPCAVVH